MEHGNFNWIAPYYDFLASCVFWNEIGNLEDSLLPHIKESSHVLVLGPGRGSLLRKICDRLNSKGFLSAVDSSERMIASCKRKLEDSSSDRVNLICHDWSVAFPQEYDCIILPFFADMFVNEKLGTIFSHCRAGLSEQGKVLLLDFFPPKPRNSLRCWWQKSLIRLMYVFFRFTCGIQAKKLPDYLRMSQESGMEERLLLSSKLGFMRAYALLPKSVE